jgi:hypothetical protein
MVIAAGTTAHLVPEFGRTKTATHYTGLSRGKLYQGMKEGWVRSCTLRKKGQKFSVRLIHITSLLEHLRKLTADQAITRTDVGALEVQPATQDTGAGANA